MSSESAFKGIVRNGKVEIVQGGPMPEGAEVLVLFAPNADAARFDRAKWAESLEIIKSFSGKLPLLPEGALSTEALYD